VRNNFRIILRGFRTGGWGGGGIVDEGFAVGDEGNSVDVGGAVCVLMSVDGGAKGTFRGGIEELEVGVAGEVDDPVNDDLFTGPDEEADPGRTTGVESFILDFLFSASALYILYPSLVFIRRSNRAKRKFSYSRARNKEARLDNLPLASGSHRN
jgi:hypothetical protein